MTELQLRIESHPFFDGMNPAFLGVVSEGAYEATYEPGEVLFHEGELATTCYLIETGRVLVEAGELTRTGLPVQDLGPGDVLGWSWMFPPFMWHYQARAVESTRVIVLNASHLLVEAECDPAFGYDLMKRVIRIVIHRLQATRAKLRDVELESALKG